VPPVGAATAGEPHLAPPLWDAGWVDAAAVVPLEDGAPLVPPLAGAPLPAHLLQDHSEALEGTMEAVQTVRLELTVPRSASGCWGERRDQPPEVV
jgi:hypothetical protein